MSARIDCKDCDSENDMGRELVYFCPLHASAANLLAGLKATLATLEEAAAVIVSDSGHSVGLAAQMEMVRRKAAATIARAERTWQQMIEDERNEALAKMKAQ